MNGHARHASPIRHGPPASALEDTEPIDTVVFDLFHTLVNPEEFLPQAYLRAHRIAYGLGLDVRPFSSYWIESTSARIRSRAPSVAQRLAEYCQQTHAPRELAEIQRALDKACAPEDAALLHPSPEVIETLGELRRLGIRIGLLSNCDERESRAWFGSPLSRLVDAFGLSCDTGFLKPDRTAYIDLLSRLGERDAGHAAYVGDGEHNELTGAKEAGFGIAVLMRGYVAGTGMRSSAELEARAATADLVIDRLPEVLPHVASTRVPSRKRHRIVHDLRPVEYP